MYVNLYNKIRDDMEMHRKILKKDNYKGILEDTKNLIKEQAKLYSCMDIGCRDLDKLLGVYERIEKNLDKIDSRILVLSMGTFSYLNSKWYYSLCLNIIRAEKEDVIDYVVAYPDIFGINDDIERSLRKLKENLREIEFSEDIETKLDKVIKIIKNAACRTAKLTYLELGKKMNHIERYSNEMISKVNGMKEKK